MRLRHLLLLFFFVSTSIAELKRICVCGNQRIPCACPPESKLNNLRKHVFRVFSVPSAPAPKPIQSPYFVLSRNVVPANPGPSFSIDQPIGYVLTNSPAEAFYLDAYTGKLIPTTRPRPIPAQNPVVIQPTPSQFPQQIPQQIAESFPTQHLTTSSRQSYLVSGGTAQSPFRHARMIPHPSVPQYPNPGVPTLSVPPQGIPLPVSGPYYPPQQLQLPQPPPPQFRQIPPQQPRASVLGYSEPNLVPVSQLTRVVKPRHIKKYSLDKPRPGDVEDLSFVDGGSDVIEEDDIDRKYKSFIAGSPPSASIGEPPSEVVRTKPRSLLETLPPGLIAKVANKIASRLPPPKFSFSITPSKSVPSFH